jgi:hypothetical protein
MAKSKNPEELLDILVSSINIVEKFLVKEPEFGLAEWVSREIDYRSLLY